MNIYGFQHAITFALNHEQIKDNPKKITEISPSICQQERKDNYSFIRK